MYRDATLGPSKILAFLLEQFYFLEVWPTETILWDIQSTGGQETAQADSEAQLHSRSHIFTAHAQTSDISSG